MRQLGTAKKLFRELVMGDKLYYIDPKKPTEISELSVKEVRKAVDKRFCVIVYFKSDEATKIIASTEAGINEAPVGKIVVPKNATDCMTHTIPPSVYFTNKKALQMFMGK